MHNSIPKYTPDVARMKMVQYCNKAERCHWDVRNKLLDWGIRQADRENIIVFLIEQNLINEKRYAEAFVHDKFEFNKWGAKKIEQHLKLKGVSERNISDALKTIANEDNAKMIHLLIKKKEPQYKGLQLYQKKIKLARYLMSKGFESDSVWKALESYYL
jgi:regulatory protein